jgi:conjugal transfer ATP-binding protein TraC
MRQTKRYARDLLPVDRIASEAVRLNGGALRAVLECPTLAFGIKGEAEQRAIVDGWATLLNSLSHPLQIVIRSRKVDPAAVAPLPTGDDKATAPLRDSYRRLLDDLAGERRILDRRFFVIVPWDAPSGRRGRHESQGVEVLEQRVSWVADSLRRLDLEPRRLRDHELADLLRLSLDPGAARQPIDPDDGLTDVAALLAPAGFSESRGSVCVGDRVARTVALTRYPVRLHLGWLGDLHSLDGDVDLALHLQPGAGASVMSFLERRIAELSSTVRITEEHGGRADPYRRTALHDALELQDRLAQGSERLFDASLYLTVWARDDGELESATQRVEALLGARLIHTRRLLFQMRPGLLSTLPLGLDLIAMRRALSTTALSATFPFTGSDLRARSGLLYGINTLTRSPVVIDRFALENHNAVIFATSGAGKSYLVKVELARALLSGIRALVIDPEGEYAPLLSRMGAGVVAVRPGAPMGLDPFAFTDARPGALSVRIATVTTLVDLLAGGLQPSERAAVEEAIAFAYARAGFADGKPTNSLVPPQLAHVQLRLRGRQGMESLALRLDRYVAGSGAWLFRPSDRGSLAANSESAAYVLAGLPEELRAAAMFLVLDQIWRGLADSVRPTLVVIDEAWWLMRHADTAAFLFRLVKTARKRRAGLTLVTQDVSDVLSNPDGEAVITNSALQILMKQSPQAMPRLADLFRLTRAEQSWLLNAQRGDGLLVAQGRRVPIKVLATAEEARLIETRERSA